jgi:ankyrin repeat protein
MRGTQESASPSLLSLCVDGRALVGRGANISAVDEDLETPLHAAAIWGNTHAAMALVSLGADLEARNEHGFTPAEVSR